MDEQGKEQGTRPKGDGIWVVGINGEHLKPYPSWRYHELFPPVIVHDTAEDEAAQHQGWKTLDTPSTGVQHLCNWRHDLEDMTAKQLVLFALEEFGVELPIEAGEEKLVKAMWELTHIAPQHSGRITLLAQSVKMDYDEVCAEIHAAAEDMEFTVTKVVEL